MNPVPLESRHWSAFARLNFATNSDTLAEILRRLETP
jgi:bifunctional pyridoxal-dependent enzyme with beta-cystathionase and maltose regulon repressor activities